MGQAAARRGEVVGLTEAKAELSLSMAILFLGSERVAA